MEFMCGLVSFYALGISLYCLYCLKNERKRSATLNPLGSPVFLKRSPEKLRPKVQDDQKAWEAERQQIRDKIE
jgi:hypothetical protein